MDGEQDEERVLITAVLPLGRVRSMKGTRTMATMLLTVLLLAPAARGSDEATATEPSTTEPAASPTPTASLTAINKALTDPVSELWSLSLVQNNFRLSPGGGSSERWNSRLQFQGAMPISLTPYLDLVTRPSIELFNSQPHPVPGQPGAIDRTAAFGDMVLQQLLVPRREQVGNWLLGVGPTWIFPSGSSKWTSTGKWQVGPTAVLGYLSGKWALAAVFQDWHSFGGSGPIDLHSMSLQPIAAYFLPEGWSVGYSGNMLANWTAIGNDRFTIPVGLQVSKVVLLGSTPVKIGLAGQWMPVHPTRFGQVWNVQLAVQVLRRKLVKGYVLSDPANVKFRWED